METSEIGVIGSGPGGSGIVALIARDDHAVILLEKNGFLGGKCSSQEQDGNIVDTGVHMFGQGPDGPFGKIAVHICHGFSNAIALKSLINAGLRGGFKPQIIGALRKAFKNHSRQELAEIRRKVSNPFTAYLPEYEHVMVKDFISSLRDSDDLLRNMVIQTMIATVIPWEHAALADFLEIQFGTFQSRGLGCLPGGSREIPKIFLRGFKMNGGIIRTGTRVKSIAVGKDRIKGVTITAGEFIPDDIVISNAGMHRTIIEAGEKNPPKEYSMWAAGLKIFCAVIAAKHSLERKVASMRVPCMSRCPELNPYEMFNYHETGEVPHDLYLFVTVPSMSDPAMAPLGKEIFIVAVPAPCEVSKAAQCEGLLDRAEHVAEKRLFSEIRGHIIKKQRTHTVQTSGSTGWGTGEYIGLAQQIGQTETKKPEPQAPIKACSWSVPMRAAKASAPSASRTVLRASRIYRNHNGILWKRACYTIDRLSEMNMRFT